MELTLQEQREQTHALIDLLPVEKLNVVRSPRAVKVSRSRRSPPSVVSLWIRSAGLRVAKPS
jgi:hypothetical protein